MCQGSDVTAKGDKFLCKLGNLLPFFMHSAVRYRFQPPTAALLYITLLILKNVVSAFYLLPYLEESPFNNRHMPLNETSARYSLVKGETLVSSALTAWLPNVFFLISSLIVP